MTATLAQLGESVVGTAYDKLGSYLSTSGEDKAVKRIVKSLVTALPNALFAVAFTIEAAVRLVLTALAKLAHFFMPKDTTFTRKFEEKILYPLAKSTVVNGELAGFAGAVVGKNFKNEDQRNVVEKKATDVLRAVGKPLFTNEAGELNAVVKAIGSVANFVGNVHFNGVYSGSGYTEL